MLFFSTRFILLQQLRSRAYVVVVGIGVMMVLGAIILSELSGGETTRIVEDVGLAAISLSVSVAAVTIALSSFSREIATREIFFSLVQPIPRSVAYGSRFLAGCVSVALANVVLGGLLVGMLSLIGATDPLARVFVAALVGGLEAIVLLAIALFLGTGSSLAVTSAVISFLFVVGRLAHELETLIARKAFAGSTWILEFALYVLPRLDRFDLTAWVAETGWKGAVDACLYGILYTAGWVLLGLYRIERRDFT